ncbi:unnamed protein product [Chironomus riparius]|uniref:Uncharacterized protein n=1 Tax=Chironomus riparius TaxID=315576 RepID=A0A9N9WY02_9DIPT|nr:unnamed protein product [Chironomus riparius]
MKVANFFKFDSNFSISMDSDKFYLRYQNIIFGWLHLVLGILGSFYAGYRAFVDLIKAKSASDLDSTYLRYVMLHLETIMAIFCFLLIWVSMIFIAGVQKRNTFMMAPFITYCILAVIASLGLIFNHLLFIISLIFYLYLCVISCRLYKLIKDVENENSNSNNVRRYEERPVDPPTITRPRTPRNSRPAPTNNTTTTTTTSTNGNGRTLDSEV